MSRSTSSLRRAALGRLSTPGPRSVYRSGPWEIDLSRRELRAHGSSVPVGSRAFDILEILVQAAGALVTKDELMDRVWPGAIVEDNALQVHISAVRKALGVDRAMLKTESGRGYRLLGVWDVWREEAAAPPFPPSKADEFGTRRATNLPVLPTSLIGRSEAVRRVRDLVSAYRVVTLTGPGGIGKTALAIEAARGLFDALDDGGWLLELGALSDPDLVPSALAGILGLKLGGGEITADSVARAVGGRRLLLILDNCEHVVVAAAGLAESLLRLCPRTTILATSREVLRIGGECVYRVPPLEVPAVEEAEPNHIRSQSAVELFIARMSASDHTFSPRGDELAAIGAICRHLDGIPLAIEFAAASAGLLGLRQVASGLRDRFALLTAGRRTARPRQRTLRAMLDWSYELLTETERSLLRRLAIFPSGFTLDAAAAVMARESSGHAAIVDGISNLVTKSLINLDRSAGGNRWKLLETIRAYGLEKLAESGEAEDAARCHASHFRDSFASTADGFNLQAPSEDFTGCVREIDNVRAALEWSFSASGDAAIGVELTAVYVPVWMHLSLLAECRERCDRALREVQSGQASDPHLLMRLQIGLGNSLLHTRGSSEEAQTVLTRALEGAEALGDRRAQLGVLLDLASVEGFRGEYAQAAAASARASDIAEQIGDTTGVVFADRRMGMILLRNGRLAEAQRCFERVMQSYPQEGMPSRRQAGEQAMARALFARAMWLQGFPERALQEARTSLGEVRGFDDRLTTCRVILYGIGRIAPMIGEFAAAEMAIAELIEAATRAAAPFWTTAGQFLRGKLLVERHQFTEGLDVLRDAFDVSSRTGWQLSYPEFMGSFALALAGLGRFDAAHDAVCTAIDAAGGEEDGQLWYVPELLRVKGEVLLGQNSTQAVQAAGACFDQAAAMARGQGALFWELRIALSLARTRMTQDLAEEAGQLLAAVYDRFGEGFAAPDLCAARALLDRLSSARSSSSSTSAGVTEK